jgi:transcriptional regulator with XRE-family HTH domain
MNATPVGRLLREWRQRRRLSQLDFATEAEISAKHLSFIETGRAQPSRDMLLKLAELLEVPLRERTRLLVAAGFAPMFAERSLDDPALQAARSAVELVLKGHEPYPALAVDRHWTLLAANRAVPLFLSELPESLLQPPVNVLRLSLHPDGLAPRIVNLPQWRASPDRGFRGRHACNALRGTRSVSGAGCKCTRSALDERCRRAVSGGDERRRAELHQHDHRVRHADRHHTRRAGARDFLSCR